MTLRASQTPDIRTNCPNPSLLIYLAVPHKRSYRVGNNVGKNSLRRLSALSVKGAVAPGRYGDGDGLYLVVGKGGAKSWIVRVQKNGRRRDIGLGSAAKVPLKLARERAALVRSQVDAGIDPARERLRQSGIPTFREAALTVHTEHKSGWKNGKHQAQWLATLDSYAFPAFGQLPVSVSGVSTTETD